MSGRKKGKNGTASSLQESVLWGIGIAMTAVTTGCLLLGKLMDLEIIPVENIGYGIMGILIAASFLGCIITCGKYKHKRLMTSLIFGGTLWVVLLSLTALLFGGQYDGVAVTGCLILGSSVCAGLAGGGSKKGRSNRKIRSVSC